MMDQPRSREMPSCSAIDLAEIRRSSKIISWIWSIISWVVGLRTYQHPGISWIMSRVAAFTFELPALPWPYCIWNNVGDVKLMTKHVEATCRQRIMYSDISCSGIERWRKVTVHHVSVGRVHWKCLTLNKSGGNSVLLSANRTAWSNWRVSFVLNASGT
jgi:hypothetical protein